MADLSEAYIALPGGIGTLEETFEAWTWLQLRVQRKPIGLLNVDGYYDTLLRFLDELVEQDFVGERHRALLQCDNDPGRLVESLAATAARSAAQTSYLDRT